MFPNPGPAKFVVFEGLDGAGTTTQVTLLRRRMAGWPGAAESRPVYVTCEPSDGPM